MFDTKITKLLNIEYPIIQGGMAWVATHELAAAVSNAGGLGIIAGGSLPGEIIRKEIKKTKELTDKPFGVNIMLLSPYAEDIVDIVCDEGIPVVTTGAGNPGKYIEKFKAHNVKVIPVVPTVSLARRLERQGVDAIIAEGTEAGGHVGEIATMALIPQVVDAVKIPVIAAGGIADGRGLIAALALGAEAVQMGTRFVCSTDSKVHDNYKEKIIKSKDRDSVVTGRTLGFPSRVLKNKFSKEFIDLEKNEEDKMVLEKLNVGRLKLAVSEGDMEHGSLMAGQISGLIDKVESCEDILKTMVDSAIVTLDKLELLKKEEIHE